MNRKAARNRLETFISLFGYAVSAYQWSHLWILSRYPKPGCQAGDESSQNVGSNSKNDPKQHVHALYDFLLTLNLLKWNLIIRRTFCFTTSNFSASMYSNGNNILQLNMPSPLRDLGTQRDTSNPNLISYIYSTTDNFNGSIAGCTKFRCRRM
jgi:hypothetical protein